MLFELKISTKKQQEIVVLTNQIKKLIENSKILDGNCVVYVPHATAAIMINENHDPNLLDDFLNGLEKIVPSGIWKHDQIDNNGAAHIKAGIIGPSETILIKDNKLILGTWQGIMLCDFDGPRNRIVYIQVNSK